MIAMDPLLVIFVLAGAAAVGSAVGTALWSVRTRGRRAKPDTALAELAFALVPLLLLVALALASVPAWTEERAGRADAPPSRAEEGPRWAWRDAR